MRASNVSLTFVAGLASAFAGAFVGGFAVGITGNTALALLLLLPVALCAAHLLGRWIASRENAPSRAELKLGCLLNIGLAALLGVGSRHGAGLVGFVVSVGVVWVLYRAASIPGAKSTVQTAG